MFFSKISSFQKENIIAIIFLCLGLSTFSGFISHNTSLFVVGQSLGFAPMPLPFRELEPGAENVSVTFSASLRRADKIQNYTSDQMIEAFSLHDRPHRAAIPFYTIANYFAVVPLNLKRSAFMHICKQMKGDEISVHAKYALKDYTYTTICKK